MEPPSPPAGRIVTFYSYKGGTGRSMTLANVAWVLASNGKRVLAVDWDLEAPGLHRYFAPFLVDHDLASSEGVIDLVIEFATEALTEAPGEERPPRDWYLEHTDIMAYAASLDFSFPRGGRLDFICAGRQGPSYSTRVNTFDWRSFYERLGGGVFLEAVRERMRAEYDYVLIDSRTGASDTSGICTVQMPDDLVVCFTLNNQSIEGAATVTASIQEQRRDEPLRIFPVPMRVELAEKDKLEARRDYCRRRFALHPGHLSGAERSAYWDAAEVLYVPYYAYEEILATFGDRPGSSASLLGVVERLTSYLTNGEVGRAVAVPETLRQDVLRRYAERPAQESDVDRLAESAFGRLGPEMQQKARRLLPRLVRLARPDDPSGDVAAGLPVGDLPVDDLRALVEAGLARVEVDATGNEFAFLAQDGFVSQWKRLCGWLAEDRDFLLWRQQIRAYLADWESTGRDPGGLLSGAHLERAVAWAGKRPEDLSPSEAGFIRESERDRHVAHARRGRRLGLAAAGALALAGLALLSVFLYRRAAAVERANLRSNAELALSQGDSAAASGDLETALRQYTTAVEGLSTYQQSVGTSDPTAAGAAKATLADALLKRGRIRDRNGDLAGAVTDYGQAVAFQPENAEAYLASGLSRSQAGDTASALSDFDKVLDLSVDPSLKATAWFYIGTAHEKAGRADEAVAAYTEAIALRRDYTDAYFNRALVHEAARRKKEAIADFEAVVRLGADPRSVEAARARLATLAPRPRAVPTPAPLRWKGLLVYVVFTDPQDDEIARRLGQILWERGVDARHAVPASQALAGKADQASPAYSEVRYFARGDQERASEVAGLAESALASLGYRASLSPVLRGSPAFRNASLEVWLPRLSSPPRSAR